MQNPEHGQASIEAAEKVAPWDPRTFAGKDIEENLAAHADAYTPEQLVALIVLEESHPKFQGGRSTVLRPIRELLGEAGEALTGIEDDGTGITLGSGGDARIVAIGRPGDEVLVSDDRGQTHDGVIVEFVMGAVVKINDVQGTELFVRYIPAGGKLTYRAQPPKPKK